MCCCRCVCCRNNSFSERDENREWCERLFREANEVESDDDFNGNLNDNFSDNFRDNFNDNIIIIINNSFNNNTL
ncbi:hypothetical protein [Lacrimispora sp. 38-1]|uniref:hypothetical protein n=1 Tax=Lacrimispora sp. 38-1 TaxID=3125778 RepID=UPI003CE7BF77